MIDTFVKAFRVRITYQSNAIIFALSSFPIIGKAWIQKIKDTTLLKVIAFLFTLMFELAKTFLGKLFYILVLIFSLSLTDPDNFVHIYLFLTLTGLMLNTYLFNPTKDKYYWIINSRMNARNFVCSEYIFEMIRFVDRTLVV